jgi:hypothetical protein
MPDAATTETILNLSPVAISLATGAVVPILTGVATKLKAASGVKATVALVLSAIGGAIVCLTQANPVTLDELFICIGTVFTANFAAYNGAWKPIGKTDHVPLAERTKNIGFGSVPKSP